MSTLEGGEGVGTWEAKCREAREQTRYFVVPAPGHYGDTARVVGSYRSYREARRLATRGWVVRLGSPARGDEWLRVYEMAYPIVDCEVES